MNDDYFQSPDNRMLVGYEQLHNMLGHSMQFISNFGIWHLSIKEAAELVVLDMWYSGEIPEIDAPDDWDHTEIDPKLRILLAEHSKTFEGRLLAAVDCGRLEAAERLRDFNERLISEKTYLEYSRLTEWLEERGYVPGDIMREWADSESDVASQAWNEIAYLRAARKSGKVALPSDVLQALFDKVEKLDGSKVAEQVNAYKMQYKSIILENQRLKEQLLQAKADHPAKVDRPITTRQRRTLLTVIAALCDYSAIKYKERGAASQIAKMTEEIGAPVTDETIAKALTEISEALDTRVK